MRRKFGTQTNENKNLKFFYEKKRLPQQCQNIDAWYRKKKVEFFSHTKKMYHENARFK